jgi:hypothetical protein
MGVRRAEVELRVDAVTAQKIAILAKSYRLLRRRIAPLLVTLLIVCGTFAWIATDRLGRVEQGAGPLIATSYSLFFGVLVAVNIFVFGFAIPVRRRARAIPQYPIPSPDSIGNVQMRELDPGAAWAWIASNAQTIRLID